MSSLHEDIANFIKQNASQEALMHPDMNICLSSEFMDRFLEARKGRWQEAAQCGLSWIEFRVKYPDWTKDIETKEFEHFQGLYQVIEESDSNGRLICVLRPKRLLQVLTDDFLKNNPHSFVRSNIWFVESLAAQPKARQNGVVFLVSFSDFTFWDNFRFPRIINISERIAFLKYIQECVGIRFGGMYAVREPSFLDIIFRGIRPFISQKMAKRIHFCGNDINALTELIDNEKTREFILYDNNPDISSQYCWWTRQMGQSVGDSSH